MERDSIDLGKVKIHLLFWKYFFPTLLGMLSISFVTLADGIFIGQGVGSDGIAAVNICVPIWMIFTGVGLMTGVGCSVVASIHMARGKIKAARLNVTQAIIFVTLITMLANILIVAFPREFGLLLGSSESLLPQVTDYMLWFIPSSIFQMWISVGLFIIRLDGAPKIAMWCSVISAIINTILDWVFIFPLGMGVKGAAIATSISIMLGGLFAISYLLFKARYLRLLMPKFSRKSLMLSIRNITYQCRIGSSAMLGEATLAMLMFMGNQVFMHYLGDNGVGAFGIACYYTPFVFMVGNAIAQSAQPIISYNFGIGNHHRVKATQKLALITAGICGIIVMLAFVFCPQFLVGLFLNPSSQAAQIAIAGFPYFAVGFICFICNLAILGYFQSVERIMPATSFAMLRGFLFLIPSFIIMPELFGAVGIWLAMPVSEILTFGAIIIFYFYKKQNKQVSVSACN